MSKHKYINIYKYNFSKQITHEKVGILHLFANNVNAGLIKQSWNFVYASVFNLLWCIVLVKVCVENLVSYRFAAGKYQAF